MIEIKKTKELLSEYAKCLYAFGPEWDNKVKKIEEELKIINGIRSTKIPPVLDKKGKHFALSKYSKIFTIIFWLMHSKARKSNHCKIFPFY